MTRGRRVVDCTVAAAGLAVAAVPLAISVAAIRATSRGPALYRQTRVGRGGRPFCLYKLRTMAESASGPQVTTAVDKRISRVGRVLRQVKIDELPQLWNVLAGDMSLIGPRPEVPRFVARYTDEQRAILDAQPGLASLAQLVYPHEADLLRDQIDPEEAYVRYLLPAKLAVDIDYERTRTWRSDARLIAEMILMIVGLRLRVDRALRVPSADRMGSGPAWREPGLTP
jgi:lipopolysaccharide/colanic/teichoic acid biosynthesis glycosyltransferase